MTTTQVDFNCNIAIINPSPTTRDMINDLPDNYTRSQNSNIFTLLYGTGYELDNLKRTLRQLEANNYLYSPDTQSHALKINGSGSYLIQFDVPFVIPPLNVSISGADYSDVYIEYADRFGMVIQVLTDITDVLTWTASGFVGAATDEVLGDALYQNFGALFNFPRQGDSQIDTSFVSKYESTSNFITVESITPYNNLLYVVFVQNETINNAKPVTYAAPYIYGTGIDYSGFPDNANYNAQASNNSSFPLSDATIYEVIVQPNLPPINNTYTLGFIQPTTVVSVPQATHELVDVNGNLIALLDASAIGSISQYFQNAQAPNANYYMGALPNQISSSNPLIKLQNAVSVYITGFQNTYTFNRWNQLSYQQEVFRADNKYRRLLAGINLSLQEGPSKQGIANIVETLFAQPYIPHEYWTQSDFRVFEPTPGLNTPKFMTATTANFATEYDSYPTSSAVVQIQSVEKSWNPNSITFNNAPKAADIPIFNNNGNLIASTTSLPITSLNSASRFDLTSKLVTDLRLGFDVNSYPQGGVINWNYANYTNPNSDNTLDGGVNTGFPLYEGGTLNAPAMNFVFLNQNTDSYAGIKLFYYFAITSGQTVQNNVSAYGCYGPLQYNSDYTIVPTSKFLVPGTVNTYNLPSDLLNGYNANANGTNDNILYDSTNSNNPSTLYNFQVPLASSYASGGYLNYWNGYDQQQAKFASYKNLPSFVVQLNLGNANRYRFNVNQISLPVNAPIFLLNTNDFLIYSYSEMNVNSSTIGGNFVVDPNQPQYIEYYDSSPSTNIIQPTGSPFNLESSYSIAQAPFAKFKTQTEYPYNVTMLGGQVTFNKTVLTSDLISLPPITPGTSPFLPQNNYYAVNDTTKTNAPAVFFHMLGFSVSNPVSAFTASLNTTSLSAANFEPPYYFQMGNDNFAVQGFLDKITQVEYLTNTVTGRSYTITNQVTQLTYGTYCLRQQGTTAILAIIDDTSPIYGTLNQIWNTSGPTEIVITGSVFHTIWDTRIPISYYAAYPPVFQASSNYGIDISTFTPEEDIPNVSQTFNNNFLVIIDGLPGGNQESVTASWSFAIRALSNNTTPQSENILGFADTQNNYGIMSLYCGRTALTLTQQSSGYVDLDNAIYNQSYTSPFFTGYFLNYKDYINYIGGSAITPQGDANNTLDTLTASYPAPLPAMPGTNNLNSVLNFFSPTYGFISISILPDMTFTNALSNSSVPVVRPNNNGLKLSMVNPSRAGLVFYGKNNNKIVDKPTRLVVTYTFDAANSASRKRIVQIEDNGYAAWTDALNPNTVNPDDTFYVTGNQYKYAHNGFDQPPPIQQYQDTFSIPISSSTYPGYEAIYPYGNTPIEFDSTKKPAPGFMSYNCYADTQFSSNEYTGDYLTNPPSYFTTFLTDPSFTPTINSNNNGEAGPPLRYRHAALPLVLTQDSVITNSSATAGLNYQSYVNPGPQKDSYFYFDLSDFPFDTTVTQATLEIYFASGFTVRDGKDINFELNNNKGWEKSRLSGNGRTYQSFYSPAVTSSATVPILKSLNNIHWRENYYEIVVPYAFLSEPNNINYGIRNYFGSGTGNNIIPGPTNPIENLEYLGFVNIDEIDSSQLIPSTTNLIETTVGLTNIVLNQNSLVYLVSGILQFNYVINEQGISVLTPIDVGTDVSTFYQSVVYVGDSVPNVQVIDQNSLLPNQKILLFPYGTSNTFFYYGYVKSLLPSTLIGFSQSDIQIYQQALEYVTPVYTQYVVKLLEADTYFCYTSFGRDTQISGTIEDISY